MVQKLSVLMMLGWYGLADIKNKNLRITWMMCFLVEGIAGRLMLWKLSLANLLVSMIPGVMILLLGYLMKGEIGMGDGILVLISGLFLGVHRTFLLLMYAVLSSGLAALYLLVVRKVQRRCEMPFVPFLLIGYVIVLVGDV